MNRISQIMARFLPLMDLSILLLGCFILVLTAAKFDAVTKKQEKEMGSIIGRYLMEHTCVMLYVACNDENGRKNGEIYTLDKDYQIGNEAIRQDSPEDIDKIINEILPKNSKREDVVVFIVSEKYAWDKKVPPDLCANLEKNWNLPRIYRVKGVQIGEDSSAVTEAK